MTTWLAPTIGVEEEFALLDPATGATVPRAGVVIGECRDVYAVVPESMQYMVETRTPVCRSLRDVSRSLALTRSRVALEARREGAVAVASGVAPYGVPDPPPVTANERYLQMLRAFPREMATTGTLGCHVHVGVPNRETGVAVLNRLRPWLPALTAFATNSPVWNGALTGWASTRYLFASRWPTGTPPPLTDGEAGYDAEIEAAVARGDALDLRNVYYVVRLSPRYPTVEVRLADVFLTAEETVAFAGLVRALVARAMDDVARRVALPVVRQADLIAACSDAARVGVSGGNGWDLVDALVDHVLPWLDRFSDTDRVLTTLYRVRVVGSGAERQRRDFAVAPSPERFVAALAAATTCRLAEAGHVEGHVTPAELTTHSRG
jgi:carboxylate-amine ligase